MFEGAVAGLLNRLLGKYVQDLDTENLNVGIFSGNVNLTDLKLKPEALYELDLPIDVKIGTIGRINLQIPWTSLYSQPVVVNIEDVLVLVGPAISNSYFDPEREKRLMRAAKRKILQDLESESEILTGPQNFFENLFTAVVNNLQIYVRNVHIRYEDSISSTDGPLACGLCLQSLSIETTNSKWKPAVSPPGASPVYQLVRLESLSLYWNPAATVLDDAETAHITPMQYYNWKHYMITGLDKFSMHHEEFEFLLKPVTCKVKVIVNRSGEARVPKLLVDAVLQDSALQLSRRQYLSIENLLKSFQRISLNRKYRHLHPGVTLYKDVKKWWHYAYKAVVEQRVRPYSWAAIKRHREHYIKYKQTYKSVLRSPNDTELKLDLQKCEDSLPIVAVVIAREQAKFELLKHEPDRIELQKGECDWWIHSSDDSDSDSQEPKSKVEMYVKTERSRSLWSHLSSPERKKVCELIGYVEGTVKQEKPKQYIEHKLNLTLANCSITLMNRSKEILVVTLTQFLVSLETRPSAKAYKLSFRAETIVIEGLNSENELTALLTAERMVMPSSTVNFLALDLEKNPLNSEANFGICCTVEPIDFVYDERAVTELINFFLIRSMTTKDLKKELAEALDQARGIAKSITKFAISRTKVFSLNVDIKGICIVVPAREGTHNTGRMMMLVLSRLLVKTDLQPALALEDATCMELEERLYDRLHAECDTQLIFCAKSAAWREARRAGDSELHLIPKTRFQLVFSNSIRKQYRLLPRYKLNLSISSLRFNLSERIIYLLFDFFDNLPIPEPNTIPVSYLASGYYMEDVYDRQKRELLVLDRITADPGYKELVKLRQKIVSAYLSRNRVPESPFDKAAALLSFQESEKAFISSEHSDEEMELFARSVDLPGFDDNVSPSNTINTLMRFIVGEVVLNLSRSTEAAELPYIMLQVTKVCLDLALMEYGPAIQLSVLGLVLADKQHTTDGQYLHLITSGPGELFNLLYRKVRANCPDFKRHFHSVEQSLVMDVGAVTLQLHAQAARIQLFYLFVIWEKIQQKYAINVKDVLIPRTYDLWVRFTRVYTDPPIPPGATKFSYSFRLTLLHVKLCHQDTSLLELRVGGLESEFVFRANDRMLLKLFLATLHVDETSGSLYPALVWPDEDKVFEMKYVRAAPKLYGKEAGGVKANGELRLYLGRLHVVLFYIVIQQVQLILEPLISNSVVYEAVHSLEEQVWNHVAALQASGPKLNLVIEIHAPVLLMPQKPSSPNLLVLNMGDLLIENFFKQLTLGHSATSPIQNPVIDNILMKLDNITLCRAVMTLAGTLEVQEPILEPISIRCDLKRCVAHQQVVTTYKEVLLLEGDVRVDMINATLGQRDISAIRAVWVHNLSEGRYIGNMVPTSPVEVTPIDVFVKKLQEFFAQGEPIRKEAMLRFTLDGIELKLYTDMDEVLSSPVRDPSHGLARVNFGEVSMLLDRYSDGTCEVKASLQSLLVEDIRPLENIAIRRVVQCAGGSTVGVCGVRVRRPALLELSGRAARGGRELDLRLDRTRANLAPQFLLQLARALADALPGEKAMEGGIVNHGYVGGLQQKPDRSSCAESTSGYHSIATATAEETPSLSISIQFRQPEIMFFTDVSKTEGHALLIRTELLIDYSCHSNTENLVVSLAGLQIMSKLQSKLKSLPPQVVLKPCDVEYSKSFKGLEEGVKVMVSVSNIDIHMAPTTIHTVTDILEEINSELTYPDDREMFNFSHYNQKLERQDEDLWSPKKLIPHVFGPQEDIYCVPKYPNEMPPEIFIFNVPSVRVVFELEHQVAVPLLIVKMSASLTLHDCSRHARGAGWLSVYATSFNSSTRAWEPLLEPAARGEAFQRWRLNARIYQGKAYAMSSKVDTSTPPSLGDASAASEQSSHKSKKKRGFESETSADEADTDNEMVFIKNPNASERKSYNVEFGSNYGFLNALGGDSDSENENEQMDKLTMAMGHLFNDDSSGDENSNEDSSAAEQSEVEVVSYREEYINKPIQFTDVDFEGGMRDMERKTVTLQEPEREDSIDSGLETETFSESTCTYIALDSKDPLNLTVTPQTAKVLCDLMSAFTNKDQAVANCIMTGFERDINLINEIGPGSTVHLITRRETDLAGNDRIIAIADYDADESRPSTPGGDTSSADLIEQPGVTKPEINEEENEWDCFEGGFTQEAEGADGADEAEEADATIPERTQQLYSRLTELRLRIRPHDLNELTVLCPQRSTQKLHVLHPSKKGTRYYVVVETSANYNNRRIVVRSPLQIRNETLYALELYYSSPELATGANPFDDKRRLSTLPPAETLAVPLHIAYHCRLYLLPTNAENFQTTTQGLWWKDLANEPGPVDVVCPSKDGDKTFSMRIVTVEGVPAPNVSQAIPNYLIRVVPPLAVHNLVPLAMQVSLPSLEHRVRIEAGEKATLYQVNLTKPQRVTIEIISKCIVWTGGFLLDPYMREKTVPLETDAEIDCGLERMAVRARLQAGDTRVLQLYAPSWLVNKTRLPLQVKASGSDMVQEVGADPLLWCGGARLHVRAQHSRWSRALRPAPVPGLLVCAHRERRTHYRVLVQTTLSELCPQLTKIITFLPYFLVYNDTKRHLRFMEENEAADLWIDLAPQQCTPFWPQTNSMSMHCKYRDSNIVSQHFPITKNHSTVLRMDKGSAITVEVTGGTDRPFTVTFRPYSTGDAPVRVDNRCDDLFLKLHQSECGQVALLSPNQSLLVTWDEPARERRLVWNIYNNKGKGYVAEIEHDGFGAEKVSFHSVKHSTLIATNSVTSKLSSTLKRLTPRSPEPNYSSSEDSDSSDLPGNHPKSKKMRKDKVIVYWISYMDGYQRVLTLTQDERIAYQYKMRIKVEKSNYEIYTSLPEVSLSVCVQTHTGVKELAYISVSDSLPQWEVNVSRKWKELSSDLTSWIEENYQREEATCHLKEYLSIDLEKMQMTKPFFSELRRIYNPGIWIQLRKSDTHTYFHLKVHRFQIDNQLHEAVYPCVLYPTFIAQNKTKFYNPSIEMAVLKHYRTSINQEVYKYLKVLIQEYSVNLDRGFVNHVFNILNHWKIEDKPAVRLRADLALVHMPLPIIAIKSQIDPQKNVFFEYVHLSPIKLVLSLSSRGYLENESSQKQCVPKNENRPKLFNSDLLEYLFNSWGSSLSDVKGVVIRMSFLELRDSPLTGTMLLDTASQHYWMQLVQQFYVLVLGQNVLGNPYSPIGDSTKIMQNYYEPYTGFVMQCHQGCISSFDTGGDEWGHGSWGPDEPLMRGSDLPESLMELTTSLPSTLALALSGLLASPNFDTCRSAERGGVAALRHCLGGRVAARRRLPRHCPHTEGVRPYSVHAALGRQLFLQLGRGHFADTERYLAHAPIASTRHTVLVSTQHIFLVRTGGNSLWHIEWVVKLDDLIGVPNIEGDKLILNIRQDELVNYFATDEKVIEVQDPEILAWLQAKIECALILDMENKRCPAKL